MAFQQQAKFEPMKTVDQTILYIKSAPDGLNHITDFATKLHLANCSQKDRDGKSLAIDIHVKIHVLIQMRNVIIV